MFSTACNVSANICTILLEVFSSAFVICHQKWLNILTVFRNLWIATQKAPYFSDCVGVVDISGFFSFSTPYWTISKQRANPANAICCSTINFYKCILTFRDSEGFFHCGRI